MLCLVAALAGCGGKHAAPPPPTAAKPVHHRPVVPRHPVPPSSTPTPARGFSAPSSASVASPTARARWERRTRPAPARPARRDDPRARLPRPQARLPFQRKRRVVVRVDHESLQWPMYGATPARTQAHLAIRVRPPFRVVWSRGLGSLIEFPAVVSDGVAYIGNIDGTVRAISMGERARAFCRRDIRHGKMAASPAGRRRRPGRPRDGRRRPRARPEHPRAPAVRVPRRLADRSRHRSSATGSTTSAPGTPTSTRSTCARESCAGSTAPAGRSPPAPRSPTGRSTSATTPAGRLPSPPGSGRLRWSAGVNGRIYGTPAVWAGRVFVPSSDGGSLTAFTTRGALPLARSTRAATSTPRRPSGRGRVYFGSYNGRLYSASARTGTRPLVGADRRPGLGRPGGRRRGRLRRQLRAPDRRRRRRTAAASLLRFPHGEYVPVSGSGGRLLLHGYSRVYAVEPSQSRSKSLVRVTAARRVVFAGVSSDRARVPVGRTVRTWGNV